MHLLQNLRRFWRKCFLTMFIGIVMYEKLTGIIVRIFWAGSPKHQISSGVISQVINIMRLGIMLLESILLTLPEQPQVRRLATRGGQRTGTALSTTETFITILWRVNSWIYPVFVVGGTLLWTTPRWDGVRTRRWCVKLTGFGSTKSIGSVKTSEIDL